MILNSELTTLFRTKVLQRDLYNTGNFFKSIKVYVSNYSNNTLVFDILGVNYGLYLLDHEDLLMDFYGDIKFKDILEAELLKPLTDVDSVLNGNVNYYKFFQIRYNNQIILKLNL